MRANLLAAVLAELHRAGDGVEASVVMSNDGLLMATHLPEDYEENRLAAITAAILSLSARAAAEFNRGTVSQILIRGDRGNFVVSKAGNDAVLVVLTPASSVLGITFIDCKRAAEEIEQIL